MKTFEYYYNIIYYFFYRGAISVIHSIRFLSKPLINLLFFLSKFFPSTQRIYDKKGITDPKKYYADKMKDVDENPDRSLATIYGAGFSIASLAFIFVGFYHILKNFFFPEFEDSFGYVVTVTGILAYTVDNLFVVQQDQGIRYIKQFNAIKDRWWRIKWSIITALTFPFSIWFMAYTSTKGAIGQFFLHLGGH